MCLCVFLEKNEILGESLATVALNLLLQLETVVYKVVRIAFWSNACFIVGELIMCGFANRKVWL